ncbi:MAG: cbb3-type cytochrome c oxidase N-terminal domain-containing protein [Bacteroidota bacterium]
MSDSTVPNTPDASSSDAPRPEDAIGDNPPSETTPDPESSLREPAAATLPEAAIGEGAVDRVMEGHTYDGIREYDNPMPGWWVAIFVITVLFAPVYMLGVHVFDFIDDYQDDLAEKGVELAAIREAYAASGPSFEETPAALQEYAQDASLLPVGAEAYQTTCASCHAADGGGLIGPNLADEYWIHDPSPEGIWLAIKEGFPAQGMPPWGDILTSDEKAGLIAYVTSLQGTTPAEPKEPQGELVVGL